jgi:sporulation protein YlmC with PRC-barrel domain
MSYADRDKYGMYKHAGNGPGPALMGADTLIGDDVVNAAEETLGEVKEIMLDMQTGQVAYAVLSFGGFLGMGDKLFAVPWQALHLDTVNHRLVLNVDKDTLSKAPGFDKDSWPDMSDVQWADSVHAFYGMDPRQGGAPSMGPGAMSMGSRMGGAGTSAGAGASMQSGSGGSAMGGSIDPRPGNLGDDSDLSRIRGSNIG